MKIKKILLVIATLLTVGCTNTKPQKMDMNYFKVYDPLESINQRIYYFNYNFDKYVFLPTVSFYEFILPNFMQKGIHNFFVNMQNASTMINSTLQFKIKKSMRSLASFTMNMAFGFGGLANASKSYGMPKDYEDFGLTLAHYGVPNGPYLILPILGPSNLRDAFGMGVDTATLWGITHSTNVSLVSKPQTTVVKGIDMRKHNSFRYYDTDSPFEYEYIKFLYTKYRMLQEQI